MLRARGGVTKVVCEGNKDLTQGRQSRAIQEKRSKGRCWRRQPLEGRKISGQKRSRRKFEREAMLRRLAETWLRFFFFFFFFWRTTFVLTVPRVHTRAIVPPSPIFYLGYEKNGGRSYRQNSPYTCGYTRGYTRGDSYCSCTGATAQRHVFIVHTKL